jgi:NAD(P)H-quinone oxidoreductase subunit 4
MLSTLLWLPIIGAIIVGLFPDKFAPAKLRQITLFFVAAVLFWSLYLLLLILASAPPCFTCLVVLC